MRHEMELVGETDLIENLRNRLLGSLLLIVCVVLLGGNFRGKLLAEEGSEKISRLDLRDTSGDMHKLSDWSSSKLIACVYVGTTCPISNGYSPEYKRLVDEFSPKGVMFLAIHPDPDVDAKAAAKHAADYKLSMTVLLDPEQRVAKEAGVSVTPEAVVLSPDGKILYRGRIDDKYLAAGPGRRKLEASERTLALAIGAILEGKTPKEARTKAHGCPLPEIAK